MIYYYIYIIISLFCIIREEQRLSDKQKLWNLRLCILSVFILMAFKGPEVGSDTSNYIHMYEIIDDTQWYMDEYGGIEPGYNLFQKVLHFISADPQTLMIGVALVVAIALFHFFKEAKYSCFAVFFFTSMGFLGFALSGLRQTIAISIGLFAYDFVKKRKLIPFLLMILLAASFHKSSVFMIPSYFMANQELKTKNVSRVFFLIMIVFFFADKFLLSIASFMDYKYGVEYTGNGYEFFLIILLITIMAIKNRNKIIQTNTSNLFILNVNFLSLAMWTIRLVSRTAERVSYFFLPYTAVLLSEHLSTFSKEKRIQQKLLWLIVATFFFLHRMGYQEHLNNYTFFFFK